MNCSDSAKEGLVLVVDDAIENIRILRHMLKDEYRVVFALDGEKAVEIAFAQSPDLILLDVLMPGMDGYEVCRELKRSVRTWDIPVIFVTSLNNPEDETRAFDAGGVDFISKPLNAAVVRARVRTHLTLKKQSDLLRAMTLTDVLTGVANRRCFDESLNREWRRCERAGDSVGLIMADIDHFKLFNDYYGHQAGDACLLTVAATLRECARRASDIVARYGGEEFAVLLPQETLDGANMVAEKILDSVRGLAIPHAGSLCAPHVTISLGVAVMAPSGEISPSAVVAAADARLYEAKAAGRDRWL